jgi:ferrochelatase
VTGFDSVLLIAFGGPEKPEDIRPFLQMVAEGRPIPPERIEEVVHHYEMIGGRSPLGELTRLQAAGLRQALARAGDARPVWIGMRNWHPYLYETLAEMRDHGLRAALGIVLSSFRTEASWERYRDDVAAAREKIGVDAPEVVFAPAWAEHPLFIEAMADRVATALGEVPAMQREAAQLIFTAHSVPVAMAKDSPYATQLVSVGSQIASRLCHRHWSVAYQSRSGSPREPWLTPDIGDRLRALALEHALDVVVAPIGFVCDHVEVLYDLDIEAGRLAEALGLSFHRAAAANDHPRFIAMLADLVRVGSAP